jgi:hypothetical protein
VIARIWISALLYLPRFGVGNLQAQFEHLARSFTGDLGNVPAASLSIHHSHLAQIMTSFNFVLLEIMVRSHGA